MEIAAYAIERGLHVLVTKPPVKTVKDHLELIEVAKRFFLLCGVVFSFSPSFDGGICLKKKSAGDPGGAQEVGPNLR